MDDFVKLFERFFVKAFGLFRHRGVQLGPRHGGKRLDRRFKIGKLLGMIHGVLHVRGHLRRVQRAVFPKLRLHCGRGCLQLCKHFV